MNFERGDIKKSLDIGLRNYPHVIRSFYESNDFPLDELEEFCRSEGKKYNSQKIRITSVPSYDVEKMHNYWENRGELPKEYYILRLSNLKGKKIVIRGKIYTVPK